ncbi:MAG: diaminopimelate epimerase [Lysobacterales bacterium]
MVRPVRQAQAHPGPDQAGTIRFSKAHGIGNDFVLIDRRAGQALPTPAQVLRMADRHRGVGFDQLLTIEPGNADSHFGYAILNADGSEAGQCGNGVRCVAAWLVREGAARIGQPLRLRGPAGVSIATVERAGWVRVEMGVPEFDPARIPFDAPSAAPSYALDVDGRKLEIGAVSMGNPHAVLEVEEVARAEVVRYGPKIERHPRFADRCNVGFVEVVERDYLRLRVFERGVGETLACGSGACAAVAVLRCRDQVDERVTVELPGGSLVLEWPGAGSTMSMSGPAAITFEGSWHE